MVNKAVMTKRSARSKRKIESAQDYEERMANKAKFHKYKNKQESERKPYNGGKFHIGANHAGFYW